MNNKKKEIIIADGHVHIHDCFDTKEFLEAAIRNFNHISNDHLANMVLFLTESHAANWFNFFYQQAEGSRKGKKPAFKDWIFDFTLEENSIKAKWNEKLNLIIIAGRQIVSEEKLEVLALGMRHLYDDGSPLEKVVKDVQVDGFLPVIPWGVGKWVGQRGKLIKSLIAQNSTSPLFLGDNGNRPIFWRKSSLFNKAKRRGILNIPGSDPLPFKTESRRTGSFGFIIEGSLNSDKPFEDIKRKIVDSSIGIEVYGKFEKPLRFVRNQLKMRFLDSWYSNSRQASLGNIK